MKNKLKFCVLGAALVLAGLWLGAFAIGELFPYGHWANFPAFCTAFIAVIGGVYLAAFAILGAFD